MDINISPVKSALYSELVLSLYPILIKNVPTTLLTQTLGRFLVFPVLAFLLGPVSEIKDAWGTPLNALASTLHGLLNLVHVGASYISFKDLPAGSAVSLFYTYPLMILLARMILFGESVNVHSVVFLLIAFCGAYLVATATERDSETKKEKKNAMRGIIASLTSAATEMLIYLFVRSHHSLSPFFTIQHLYPSGLVFLLIYALYHPKQVDKKSTTWFPLIAFNAILGFTGYILRFFSIPKLPTIMYSALSFIGVMSAYIWGLLFADEKPSLKAVVGGGLIATAIGFVRYFES